MSSLAAGRGDAGVAARLDAGDLAGATEAVGAALKAAPGRADLRLTLADLLILAGDYERADRTLTLLGRLQPADAVGVGRLRGFLQGLMARRAWYETGALPSFPNGPTAADAAAIRLDLALRADDAAGARQALDELEAARSSASFSWNGEAAPGGLRDLDDRLPHAFEAVTSGGNYLWADFALVRRVVFERPDRPRDLALRRARLELRDGSSAEVMMPAVYPDAAGDAPDDALALARRTDFADAGGGLSRGRGQRSFLVGDEAKAFLEARLIEWEADDG